MVSYTICYEKGFVYERDAAISTFSDPEVLCN